MGTAALVAGPDPTAYAASAGNLAPTAGCGRTPTLTSGRRTIQSSGQNRTFILRVPDNYDSNHPYRLVFAFPWNGGTANDVDSGGTSGYPWSYFGLRALSNNSAIFVAPQGNGNGWANPNGQDHAVDGSADPYAPGERSWTEAVVWKFFTQFDGTTPPDHPADTHPDAQRRQRQRLATRRCPVRPVCHRAESERRNPGAELQDCPGQSTQTWTYTSSKQLQLAGNMCLDANGAGTTVGTAVIVWTCNGQPNQQWSLRS